MNRESSKKILSEKKKIYFYRNITSFLLQTLFLGLTYIPELAINYFFKDELKVEPSQLTRLLTISRIPWVIKPVFGIITDFYPIFGYKRKCYLLFCGIIFCVVWLILGFLKINSFLTVICLFISNLTCCFSTVLSQATMIEIGSKMDKNEDEEIKEEKNQTNILITYNTIISNFGILIGSYLKGELIQKFNIRIVFIITSCLGSLLIISAIILKEFRYDKKKNEKDNNSFTSSFLSTSTEEDDSLIGYICQKKVLIPLILFLIVTTIPGTYDPFFYYEADYLKFKPVDFSIITIINQIIALFFIYNYDKLQCISTKYLFFFIRFISTSSGFILYSVHNGYYKKFNIDPFYIILFVTTIQYSFSQIYNMIIYKLSAKLSIKRFEGTVFSTFTATMNFGNIMGQFYGSILTDLIGITRKDFTNFGKFIIIANILSVFPTLFILLTPSFYFNPKNIKDEIIFDGTELNDKEFEEKIEINDEEKEKKEKEKKEKELKELDMEKLPSYGVKAYSEVKNKMLITQNK